MAFSLPHIMYVYDMSSVEHYICQMVVGILMRHSDGIRSRRLQSGNYQGQLYLLQHEGASFRHVDCG